MESPAKAEVNEIPREAATNERSTIEFPYSDLDSSVEIVRGVHTVGGTACEYHQLAAQLGLEAKGGGFRIRVNAAKTFGLLLSERGGHITLTELGRQIIDPQFERGARAKAFLEVPLFSKVYENYKGSQLPPPAAIERTMISYGVGSKVAKNARQVLMRSGQQAGYFDLSSDRLTAPPIRIDEQAQQEKPREKPGGGEGGGSGTSRQVQLRSGGTLTLTASIDLFQLSAIDRKFVFDLIDKLQEYERESDDSNLK